MRLGTAAALAAGLVFAPLPAAAMTMSVDGDQVLLEGAVVREDIGRLAAILRERGAALSTVILRNSPGGNASAGYEIGAMIRKVGLRTAVSGFCRSSCSRMFLGGRERHFSDEQPVGVTHVGLHGNYADDGRLARERMPYLRKWIAEYSDGKADPALVERWTSLENRRGFMYFLDANRLGRPDGVSMFLCTGDEPRDSLFTLCEKFPGRSGYEMGIFTSPELVAVNPKLRLGLR